MLPLTEIGKVAQDDVSDECYPDLPFHSPLIVSHEVAELQALLELFEEDFNCPAAFVEIADAAGRELHVVRDEDHDLLLVVDDYSRYDPPKPLRISSPTLWSFQDDLVITQHFAVSARLLTFLSDSVNHVALGTRDPRDVFASQFVEMIKVDIGFVEDDDFPCFDAMTDFPSSL